MRTALTRTARVAALQARHCAAPAGDVPLPSSFAAAAFRGRVVPEEMFPFPTYKSEDFINESLQAMLDDNTTQMLAKAGAADAAKGNVSAKVWASSDILGAAVPEDLGGQGLTNANHCRVVQHLVQQTTVGGYALSSAFSHDRCVALMKLQSSQGLKGRYLTKMSNGDVVGAFAPFETNVYEDIGYVTASATLSGDATARVSGTKVAVGGADATHFFVLAQCAQEIEGQLVDRLAWFIVPRDAAGLTVTRVNDNVVEIAMKDVVVPIEDCLGQADGHGQFMFTLFSTPHLIGSAVVASARKIISDEKTRALLAPHEVTAIEAKIYALESLAFTVAANLDRGVPDVLLEASFVSHLANRLAADITGQVLVHGPRVPAGIALEASQLRLAVASGAQAAMLQQTASLCGLEDFAIAFNSNSTMQIMQTRAQRTIGMVDALPTLAVCEPEVKAMEKAVLKLSETAEAACVRYGVSLLKEEYIVGRVGEIAALVTAGTAALSRAQRAHSTKQKDAKNDALLASAFVTMAVAEINLLNLGVTNTGTTADEAHARICTEVCNTHCK